METKKSSMTTARMLQQRVPGTSSSSLPPVLSSALPLLSFSALNFFFLFPCSVMGCCDSASMMVCVGGCRSMWLMDVGWLLLMAMLLMLLDRP